MTKLEQEQAELIVHCLPRITEALESIAKSLETQQRDATRENRVDAYKELLSELKPRDKYGKAGD